MNNMESKFFSSKLKTISELKEKEAMKRARKRLVIFFGLLVAFVCLFCFVVAFTNRGMVNESIEIGMWEYCNSEEDKKCQAITRKHIFPVFLKKITPVVSTYLRKLTKNPIGGTIL